MKITHIINEKKRDIKTEHLNDYKESMHEQCYQWVWYLCEMEKFHMKETYY